MDGSMKSDSLTLAMELQYPRDTVKKDMFQKALLG